MQQFTPQAVANILENASDISRANVFEGNTQKPFEVQAMTIALDTAADTNNPFKVSFPFKSVYVSAATDVLTTVNLKPNSRDSYQSSIPMYLKDSYILAQPCASGFLDWSAQAGKTITLLFFVSSEFRSGSQISVTGGGVSVVEGSATVSSQVTLVALTPTLVLSADSSRKISSIQNNTGAAVWFGTSVVSSTGANQGYRVSAGGTFYWRNTGLLYAYSIAGGAGDSGLTLLTES